MGKMITSEVVVAYSQCPRKAFLLLEGKEKEEPHEYVKILEKQRSVNREKYIDDLRKKNDDVKPHNQENLKQKDCFLINAVLKDSDLEAHCDILTKDTGKLSLERFYYPTVIVGEFKISKEHKTELSFAGYLLGKMQGKTPDSGLIVGMEGKRSKIKLESYYKKLEPIIQILREWTAPNNENYPSTILNTNCPCCVFKERCEKEAIKNDHLSLLRGMSETEIKKQNQKGIFTVTQLSYTFRPRKIPKRTKNPAKPHYFALQALSLREKKIHIHGDPKLPTPEIRVYFDIEGMPDRDFYYLIGIVVVQNGIEKHQAFWIDSEDEQVTMFKKFIEYLEELSNYHLFHFGNYEMKALKQMRDRLPESLQLSLDSILNRCCNVLSIIYPHVYFPTYSNGLKEIGNVLGYKWKEEKASGINSIVWRTIWEEEKNPNLKEKLIQYNKDDCLSLKTVCEFIEDVTSPKDEDIANRNSELKVTETSELQKKSTKKHVFGKTDYAIKDFEYINKCAYFDYQREKIYARTDKRFKIINKRITKKKKRSYRPNKFIELRCEKCSFCGKKTIKEKTKISTTIIDMKFFKGGVKKWIIQYDSWDYECRKCKEIFRSSEFPNRYVKYGHGLMSWCVYNNVARRFCMDQIRKSLGEVFELNIPQPETYRFKGKIVEFYKPTYQNILHCIKNSPIIHIDETKVKLRKNDGYVWVMTSLDRVYYFYRESREGKFLKEMLGQFSGVLISDFYSVYDSIDCPQQKCIVHLLRDINDDLLKNPFDDEFKMIAQQFGEILKKIIDTVDRYGLKKRYLHKHKKPAVKFLETVSSQEFSSELALKYQKRFNKIGGKIFTFIDYDGVPWNNNNAESAIKPFAKQRRNADGRFTERSLCDLLVLLSVFQTCEFNNIDVLKFILSKKTDFSDF